VVKDLDELLEGLLEVDVVLPERVVGVDKKRVALHAIGEKRSTKTKTG
jgi:hypothetical protein